MDATVGPNCELFVGCKRRSATTIFSTIATLRMPNGSRIVCSSNDVAVVTSKKDDLHEVSEVRHFGNELSRNLKHLAVLNRVSWADPCRVRSVTLNPKPLNLKP